MRIVTLPFTCICLPLLLVCTAATAVTTAPSFHVASDRDRAVEHADLIPAGGDALDIYLVIWNGTNREISITDLSSPLIAAATVIRDEGNASDQSGGTQVDLRIPSRAELIMQEGGTHMRTTARGWSPRPGDFISLKVGFGDGSAQTIEAVVRGTVAEIEDHHHGMNTLRSGR